MAKGYWIVHVDVRDPEGYQLYVKANAAAFAKYGARFLVRGGTARRQGGRGPARNVVIEFRDYATALACHDSEEYREAAKLRDAASVVGSRDRRRLRGSATRLSGGQGSMNGRDEADRERRRGPYGPHGRENDP